MIFLKKTLFGGITRGYFDDIYQIRIEEQNILDLGVVVFFLLLRKYNARSSMQILENFFQ